jgi:hypothetical protein
MDSALSKHKPPPANPRPKTPNRNTPRPQKPETEKKHNKRQKPKFQDLNIDIFKKNTIETTGNINETAKKQIKEEETKLTSLIVSYADQSYVSATCAMNKAGSPDTRYH